MPWYCLACGKRRGGPHCTKQCIKQHRDLGAERIPRLDGFINLDAHPEIPEEDDLAARNIWFAVKRKREEVRS